MELDPQDVRDFGEAVRGLDTLLDHVKSERTRADLGSPTAQAGNVNFTIQAGGIGLRIAVTICLLQFVLLVCGLGFEVYVASQQNAEIAASKNEARAANKDVEDKYTTLQAYINEIYRRSTK